MKYFSTFLVLLLATPCFAVLTRTYTVCEGGGCDYATLQAAETDLEQDLVANDSALTIEIQNTWVSADGNTTFADWTTDATRFLTVTAVGDARATGKLSTTAYRAIASATMLVINTCSFLVIDGLQAETTQGNGTLVNIGTNSTNVTIKNCFLNGGSISGTRGFISNGNNAIIRNNVIIDCANEGITVLGGTAGGTLVDNNTIENCGDGIDTGSLIAFAHNNIFMNCTVPLVGNFTELSQDNWTDNGSISYGTCSDCGTGDQVSQSDPFEDLGGEDYNLASGSSPIDVGQDLSGAFTDAIGNKTRDANFDKGADEFIAAATGKKVMIRK